MIKIIFKIAIIFISSPIFMAAYFAGWVYIIAWLGWYWGIENCSDLMGKNE